LDTLLSASYYEGQEQLGTPTQPDETFVHEEDEEGFIPSGEEEEEEGEDYEDGTEELEEDLEEEQVSLTLGDRGLIFRTSTQISKFLRMHRIQVVL